MDQTQRMRANTFYPKYSVSTKNFDGELLCELFFSTTRTNNRMMPFKKRQIKLETKKQNRNTKAGSQLSKHSEEKFKDFTTSVQDKSSNFVKLLAAQYQNRKKSLELNIRKIQSNVLNKRQCFSGQGFYQKLCKSIQARGIPKNEQNYGKSPSLFLSTESSSQNKVRKLVTKKKQRLLFQDFLKSEEIVLDPWAQGKLRGYSAESISIMSNGKKVYSYQADRKRQIASLTKIMTCITCLYLAKKYQINIKTCQIKVLNKASGMIGTTAELLTGDVLTMYDALHGMMLPSGNDAAQALADFFHKYMTFNNKQLSKNQTQAKKDEQPNENKFIEQMNSMARHLKMTKTYFENPHGLSNPSNFSTSNDMVQLCHYAMKNSDFRQIVKCTEYQAKIYSHRQKLYRKVKWINTNKLLELDHCVGIKTGITPTAGPCMAASFQKDNFNVIIVILNAKSKNKRFQEVEGLYQWARKLANI